jgi:hypothetical protein
MEVNSTHMLLAMITDGMISLLYRTLHLFFHIWKVAMSFSVLDSYYHGGIVFIEGICYACPPFCEDYISDIGSYYAIISHVPNVFYFPAVWAC